MKLSTAVEQFIATRKLDGLAPQTLIRYRSDLRLLTALATVEASDSVLAFTPALVLSYFTKLSAKGLTMATLHRRRAALSEFAKWGLRQRLWAENPMLHAPRIRRPRYLPRPYTPEERERLMTLELSPIETVMRALLYYTGLRVTPICGIRIGDLSAQPMTIGGLTFPGTVRTVGKGSKPLVTPIHPDLHEILVNHVLTRTDLDPRTFVLAQKYGKPFTRRMVAKRTNAWGAAAKVEHCEPHRFRHTFATALLEQDVHLRVIQALMGHEDISSTALYMQVVDRQAAAAVLKLPSYRKPDGAGVIGPDSVPGGHDPEKVSRKSAK